MIKSFIIAAASLLALAGCGTTVVLPVVADKPASSMPSAASCPDATLTCAAPRAPSVTGSASASGMAVRDAAAATIERYRSMWVPVSWLELPGWGQDPLSQAWDAWLRSCERPAAPWLAVCRLVRQQSLASDAEKAEWMMAHLQPYRVLAPDGSVPDGLLTSYYEPVLKASRLRQPDQTIALYRPPADLGKQKPWFSRQEMDTLAQAQVALAGRELVWLSDPVDALILQIQGSGRVWVQEPNGTQRAVRLAFAGHNDHPYQSVARWLLDQQAIRDASWPSIRQWVRQNPSRASEMLWRNPRVVFFKEEPLSDLDADVGPKGAQGVPLTPGRSIAVDRESIPYGTPVWLSSTSATTSLQRLVLAQDTGGAIVGAVRADYFAGWGDAAGQWAGTIKQPLQMWALWPKSP